MTNLERWNFYLRDLESPQQFIDWTFYWTVAAALQRRVYFGDFNFTPLFPNLFVVFVAEPGIGKSMSARIGGVKILKTLKFIDAFKLKAGVPEDKCWTDVIPFSADNTTLQSLIDQLAQTTRTFDMPAVKDLKTGLEVPQRMQHCSMSILLSEEMTSLFSRTNEGIVDFLNACYDSQDYHYKTKHNGEARIKNICVNFLGCTTPDNMKKLMGQGILQQGFTARALPIFASKSRHKKSRYVFTPEQDQEFQIVKKHIEALTKVRGEIKYSKEAEEYFDHYYETIDAEGKSLMDKDRMNYDKRTDHYFGRKKVHIQKMSMVLHFCDNLGDAPYIMTLETLKRAIALLSSIEPQMHHALASSGRNPLYDITKDVYEAILKSGEAGLSGVQIKIMFAQDIDMEHELPQIIKYLTEIGKIKTKTRNGKLAYASTSSDGFLQ